MKHIIYFLSIALFFSFGYITHKTIYNASEGFKTADTIRITDTLYLDSVVFITSKPKIINTYIQDTIYHKVYSDTVGTTYNDSLKIVYNADISGLDSTFNFNRIDFKLLNLPTIRETIKEKQPLFKIRPYIGVGFDGRKISPSIGIGVVLN